MANAIYPLYKQALLSGSSNCDLTQTSATLAPFVSLVSTASYTYSAAHQYYSSLAGIVGTDQQITSPSVTNGTFNGAGCTFTAVTGAAVGALVIYRKNSGANTTWVLVLYEDTSVTGLPVTPNGGNIVITWNGSGIFTLSDVRAKENVFLIGEIRGLGLYEYTYAGDEADRPQIGFLAQEVAAFSPDCVATSESGDGLLSVDYGKVFDRLAA